MTSRCGARRRGLTVLELMLALAVTAMVGVGIASMLTMVSQGAQADRDGRSAVVRAHAAQVRMRAYLDVGLNVLQHDPSKGIAVWLHDANPGGMVNLTELRVIWFDTDAGQIVVEHVKFPDAWSPEQKAANDVALIASSDFFTVMESRRALGHTRTQVLVDKILDVSAAFNAASAPDATRVRLTLRQDLGDGREHETLLTFGLANHQLPKL